MVTVPPGPPKTPPAAIEGAAAAVVKDGASPSALALLGVSVNLRGENVIGGALDQNKGAQKSVQVGDTRVYYRYYPRAYG